MRSLMTPATLLAAAALMVSLGGPQAQAQAYTWQGPTLLSNGLTTNGCNLRVPSATHSGSLALSNIFVTVQNRGTGAVRITGDVELSSSDTRKGGRISGIIQANGATASMQAMTPGGSTRNNTVLRVTITSCAPYTP